MPASTSSAIPSTSSAISAISGEAGSESSIETFATASVATTTAAGASSSESGARSDARCGGKTCAQLTAHAASSRRTTSSASSRCTGTATSRTRSDSRSRTPSTSSVEGKSLSSSSSHTSLHGRMGSTVASPSSLPPGSLPAAATGERGSRGAGRGPLTAFAIDGGRSKSSLPSLPSSIDRDGTAGHTSDAPASRLYTLSAIIAAVGPTSPRLRTRSMRASYASASSVLSRSVSFRMRMNAAHRSECSTACTADGKLCQTIVSALGSSGTSSSGVSLSGSWYLRDHSRSSSVVRYGPLRTLAVALARARVAALVGVGGMVRTTLLTTGLKAAGIMRGLCS
eukprot:Unigene14953_Nuclearia_a/m.44871 Unigene14953_Nuclearia_a/g.44871  ORF Unigene14953_Nuclearia_a/g.44871 Unigene14953_Nuclearia_a/m.44871 type:complete len:340 (+) Unigene14953_Nuclearia_a:627-1646(+)